MQHPRRFVPAILLACLPMLGACSPEHSSASSGGLAASIDGDITTALDNAKAELRSEPITVSHNDPMLPKAQIAPNGDFIVGGKTVVITSEQRGALLEYREQMIGIASAGIAIGKQGAALGISAAGDALAAALSGKSDQEVEDGVKAKTAGIRQAAARLCDRLPAMLTEQQKLAAALPAFKPYATMTERDISDCRTSALKDDDASRAEVRQSVRDRIRSGIRSGIQGAAQGTGLASRGTPDASAPALSSSARQP